LLELLPQVGHLRFKLNGSNPVGGRTRQLTEHTPEPPTFEVLEKRGMVLSAGCPENLLPKLTVEICNAGSGIQNDHLLENGGSVRGTRGKIGLVSRGVRLVG
jgi:hypothetical protein